MINLISQTLAVPYGYTKELPNMDSNDLQWHEVCNNNSRNLTSVRNGPMLPDLILDTPPPSPLRRAHSYHFTFPEKSSYKPSPDMALPPTPGSSLPSSPYSLPPTPTSLPPTPSTADDELAVPSVCVERIQAVRRQILADPEARLQPTDLPQLTWDVPLPSRIRRHQPEPQVRQQQETEDQRTWRNVGGDLRRIADKFHLDYAMVREKSNRSNTGSNVDDIAIPMVFTHCLQVSLVAIICWRLLNKFG